MTDQDRHAMFMVEAMRVLLPAVRPSAQPGWELAAKDAGLVADALLAEHRMRFEHESLQRAPDDGQRYQMAFMLTAEDSGFIAEQMAARGLLSLSDALRAILAEARGAWK